MKRTILVVDDEKIIRESISFILKKEGYHVSEAENGKIAYEKLLKEPFDLVITDLTMPGMTGLDLSRRLLQIRPDLPIILCTGYSEKVDAPAAEALGIQGFLMKPVLLKELAELVRKVLNKKCVEP
mgnify:CR=1 FL=1